MKKLIILICCLPLTAAAQNFYFSFRGGLANYQGDLQAKQITLNQAGYLLSLGGRYDINEHLSARTFFSLATLKADDKKGTPSMQMRNLNFKTKVFDWELGAQYNFTSLNNKWWSPYIFAGIGLYHFNPYTNAADGSKTFLHPLSTEGQGILAGSKPYKLTQFSIPFALGAEYAANEDIRIGLEFGYRKIFTDYLDDVSHTYVDEATLFNARGQTAVDLAWRGDEVGSGPYPAAKTNRGNATFHDAWYYMALTVTVRSFIDQYKRIAGLPSYKRDKKVGCPGNKY